MTLLKENPRTRRWISFLVGGCLNTGLTYCIYLLLSLLVNYQAAYAVAYLAGIAFSYAFNSKIVFQVERSWKGLLLYPSVYLIQYLTGAVLLQLLVEKMNLSKNLAPIAVIILLIPLSYTLSKIFIKIMHKPMHP